MNALQIVRAAIPGADESTADAILWGRTPYPFAPVTARDLYRAADRLQRATVRGFALCEFCDRRATRGSLCADCDRALHRGAVNS